MDKNNPKVSIVIPVYNGSNYLREAIDSVLNQTYKNIEVIVVNDGSNDNGATDSIAKSYRNKICYLTKENGGVATALNLAIKNANGEYISWLSHDDFYYPDKIESQVHYLNKMNKDVVLFSDFAYADDNMEIIKECTKGMDARHKCTGSIDWLILNQYINGCTLLIPKKAMIEAGLFDTSLRTTQDYDLWYKISKGYEFIYVPKCLVKIRLHSNQDSRSLNIVHEKAKNDLEIYMVKNLSDDEIKKCYPGSKESFYFNTALEFLFRRHQESFEYAKSQLDNDKWTSKLYINILNLIEYLISKLGWGINNIIANILNIKYLLLSGNFSFLFQKVYNSLFKKQKEFSL